VETICPFCHQKHAISAATVRKQMRCPGCHHTFMANPVTGLGIAVKTPPPTVVTRNTSGMPPLPDTRSPFQPSTDPLAFLSEGETKEPADLLAGYQATRRRSTSPFARIVEAVKKPIRVARLRRQVTGLQQALDAALEKLGTLALGHRPFHFYLSAEVPELSALQQQVGAKQSMADSLRHTKGSNAVLRDVEAELAGLLDRQRKLMISIGQKAEASRPDIPDGPAHYAAVSRLRSSLETAERELLGIEGASRAPAGRFGTSGSTLLSRTKMPLIATGAVLAIILVLWAGWWLLTPSVPRHIRKVVFDESKFSEPLMLDLPGDDREAIAHLKAKRRGEQVSPMFHRPAAEQFPYPDEQREALLALLIGNGFAQMQAMETDTFMGQRNLSLLTYRDALKPYCVNEMTLRHAPRAPARVKGLQEEGSQFTSPFHIAIADRQLKSIDYKNAYQGQIPPLGVKTDFYAVTFSYCLKGTFPGLPTCDTVFKGKAKAFYDPDTGKWNAEVELDDEGGHEYLKLLATQKKHGP